MQRPNFFIVGAPKSGTTAIAQYLSEHQSIYFSNPKEPEYFAFDFPGHRSIKTWEEYLKLFEHATACMVRAGEGSVWYLYSRVAISEIRRRFSSPETRLIVLLRRPDEMVISLYVQQRRMGIEDAPTFAEAWRAEHERRNGLHIPITCKTPEFLFYREVAKYGEQLRRLYEQFPPDQVKVFLYEEFAKDPQKTYYEILEFLGVANDGRKHFPVVNAYTDIHSEKLQVAVTYGIQKLRAIKEHVINKYGINLAAIRVHRIVIGVMRRINIRRGEKREVSRELKEEIRMNYKEDILLLGQLLGRDLSSWFEEPADE